MRQTSLFAAPGGAAVFLREELGRNAISLLPIGLPHVLRLAELPPLHRDPFDRLLIAQAQVEGLPVLTADRAIKEVLRSHDLVTARMPKGEAENGRPASPGRAALSPVSERVYLQRGSHIVGGRMAVLDQLGLLGQGRD